MDEAFSVVVEPEVLAQRFEIIDDYDLHSLRCVKCKGILPHDFEFSIIHLLYLVKKHLKECRTE